MAESRLDQARREGPRRNAKQATPAARDEEDESLEDGLKQAAAQVARTELMLEEWRAHSADLSQSLEALSRRYHALQNEKDSLYFSPGWQIIQRYREWLERSRVRHSWVDKYWEPSVLWFMRQTRLGNTPCLEQRLSPLAANDIAPAPHATAPAAVEHPIVAAGDALSAPSPMDAYGEWIRESEPDEVQLEIQRCMSRCFSHCPTVSVLVPVYKVPVPVLRDTIESVQAQTYENWELCVTVSGKGDEEARAYLQDAALSDSRIRLKTLERNEGISGNSNQALTLATGEHPALLDHDDTLAPFALFEVVQLINQDPGVNFIYSDKDQISADGKTRMLPLFKPQWSPEIMLNANYLTHLCVMRTSQVREIGGWRKETDGAQDWDLFLRIIQSFGHVRHIAKVLYHWRQISTSVAVGGLDAKPYAAQGQVRAVKDYCYAIGLSEGGIRHEDGVLHIEWPVLKQELVSIVFLGWASHADTLLRATQLSQETKYGNFEIVIPMLGESSVAGNIKCVAVPADASLGDSIEWAVKYASGETLVFLDEGVVPTASDWLTELIGPLQLTEVGIVGAKLLDAAARTLRHCGIVCTADGRLEHIYAGQPEHASEQAGSAGWYRNCSAVSGACFTMRRSTWDSIEGLSGEPLHPRLDIDLNLRLRARTDLRIVYNPYARMLQGEESVFEKFTRQGTGVRGRLPDGDPFFSPNLDCRGGRVTFRTRSGNHTASVPNYSAESQALVEIFDFLPAQVDRSNRVLQKPGHGRLESITWFVPEFRHVFYGGIHTILRFADTFWRTHKVRSTFCTLGNLAERGVRAQVAAAFPELAACSEFYCFDDESMIHNLPATDASVCTLWTTAYPALKFQKARRKFYFIQDDEALFYPAGSISALVEATYKFGFHGICNSVSLLDNYASKGGQGEFFSPCVDTNIFHNRNRFQRLPHTLFCYGRPGHPRNSFELLSAALRILKQRMGDSLLAISAGAEWDPRDYNLRGVLHNLGVLTYVSTGALYRMCDAGVAIMMTRHPSYLPMELMACGSLVVTNSNSDTSWLLKDGENCLLSAPSPSSLADRLQEGLENEALRTRITGNASSYVQTNYSRWEEQIEKIYRYMVNLC